MRTALLLVLLLPACGGDPVTTDPDPTDTDGDAAVTWYGDVEPIVANSCWRCHNADGVGTGDWTKYEVAAPKATLMAAFVAGGVMPPASADPSCRSYHGDEGVTLTQEQIDTISEWALLGAPEGDPADAIEQPTSYVEHLDDADLELRMPVAHTIDVDSSGNEYACFLVEHGRAESFYVTGFDVLVDNSKSVHHLVLFKDKDGDVGEDYGASDVSNGFRCQNPIMGRDWEFLHAWAPGMPPTELPEGGGMKVEASASLVLQVHYFAEPGADVGTDQSAYALRTTPSVDNEVYMFPVGPDGFTIPAGAAAHRETFEGVNDYGMSLDIIGTFPHMHLLGTSYSAKIEKAEGGEECLVRADDWDFHNQATYVFREPATFAPGDNLKLECTWDNSSANPNQYNDPPQDVRWGEGTNEEMCYFLTYVSLSL